MNAKDRSCFIGSVVVAGLLIVSATKIATKEDQSLPNTHVVPAYVPTPKTPGWNSVQEFTIGTAQIAVGQKYGNFAIKKLSVRKWSEDSVYPEVDFAIEFSGEAIVSGTYAFHKMPGEDCLVVDAADRLSLPQGLPYSGNSLCLSGSAADIAKLKNLGHATVRIGNLQIRAAGKDGSPEVADLEQVF